MKEEAVTDPLLRQFLLGKVEDEERQRIETLFLTDSLVNERVLAAEQNLIDDYVEDRLSPADRETFLLVYGDTAAQRRKLRIAKSIQEWAVTQPSALRLTPERALSTWGRLFERLRFKPVLIIPIAVATSIAIVAAFVWVNSRTERHRQYLAVQEELTRLNTPSSLRESPPGMSLLTLKPGSIRSVESETELKRSGDSSVAELRLLWTQQEEYPTYHVVLRRPGNDQPYTVPDLRTENENGKFIRVRLPSNKLVRGNYQIELSGVSAEGVKSTPEVYTFTVSE